MSCERGSRPVVAGWQLCTLVLFLFSVMPHRALSQGLALPPESPLERRRNITCNSVPYPFGARGSSLPGFEVTCGLNNEAMLQIGDYSYKMQDVSMDGGFVVIFAGPIRQVCYNGNGKRTQATGTGDMSLGGTPFSFSMRNRLVVTGCNYKLVANFSDSLPVPGDNPQQTYCSSWCDGSSNAVNCINNVACCEAHIPTAGAQNFTLIFDKTSSQVTGDENGSCSAAFFLHQDDPEFMGGGQRQLKDLLLPAVDRRMILDWAIGRVTCDQASTYSFMPQDCNSMSGCIDAPRGAGYLCKCTAGYGGNPYVVNGCADINECRSDNNDCSFPELCNNTEGGFTCSCPHNFIGDGHKTGTGTGCNESFIPFGNVLMSRNI